ncbi:MAG: ribosome small subunit-dependent GTPase A [Clostridia bacterium]|jgi:ribosome biogenesis GTPase / thiamine phosphate phosphatase|nr:ribosome small subunit-dependent GTPase A [Clostridia bacterium]MBT7122072.1 ribosome small subunit-dependent GTPase A [Clostridia bacterium]
MSNIEAYGYKANYFEEEIDGAVPARVTAVHRERFEIVSENGTGHAKLKPGVYYNETEQMFPTAGDFVLVVLNEHGDSQIVKTGKRKSCFVRKDPDPSAPLEQVVAANFDYVFIMSSLNNDLNYKRLDRYLALAWQSGATPVILLNKADLAQDWQEAVNETSEMAPGVDVVAISAKTGEGIDALEKYLQRGSTVVFLGSSGVGKSSLVNSLEGQTVMAVNDIREDDSKGRHTTTHRQLVMLSCGAMVIDTPGMRELGMWDAAEGVVQTFSDIEAYFEDCKFGDCSHMGEPGCAVQRALESGQISQERWDSYLKLMRENKYIEEKSEFIKGKREKGKQISKYARDIKKHGKNYRNRVY